MSVGAGKTSSLYSQGEHTGSELGQNRSQGRAYGYLDIFFSAESIFEAFVCAEFLKFI